MVLLRFLDQIPKKKPRVFLEFFKIQKKTLSFPKFQKIHQSPQIFLEFWKTQGFFGNFEEFILVENLEKPKVFFGIYCEIPKKPWVFLRFLDQIPKKPGFFLEFFKILKKNIEFSKIPKNSSISPNMFGILENPRFSF